MIAYFISILGSVSTRLAISEWLKYCMYFAVFFMITDLASTMKDKLIVLWTVIAASVGLCVVGLDSASGGKLVDWLNNGLISCIYRLNFLVFTLKDVFIRRSNIPMHWLRILCSILCNFDDIHNIVKNLAKTDCRSMQLCICNDDNTYFESWCYDINTHCADIISCCNS